MHQLASGGTASRACRATILTGVAALVLSVAPAFASAVPITERVSVSSAEAQAGAGSEWSAISADGRFVAFMSYANDLVVGDMNGTRDVFVRDLQNGTTERVSVTSSETQSTGPSGWCGDISADGRYVVFSAEATDLVPGDTNGKMDVFVRDRQSGTTERVSVSSTGTQGDYGSYRCTISSDCRYVAFTSIAENLVATDTNAADDVFVRDRVAGTTEIVSLSSLGAQGSSDSGAWSLAISADGRYVSFESLAWNLVPGDTNIQCDVFVRDRQSGLTERVSIASGGAQADGLSFGLDMTPDGRFVAFYSWSWMLVPGDIDDADVFVRDRQNGTTERVSVPMTGTAGDGESYHATATISADGRYVAFTSAASNLVSGDTNGCQDVFVRDRQSAATQRVSLTSGGVQSAYAACWPSISADGSRVSFLSSGDDYVVGDTNGCTDVFVRVLDASQGGSPPETAAVSVPAGTDVTVAAGGVQVSFDEVTVPGTLTVTPVTDTEADESASAIGSFRMVRGAYYDIDFSGAFSGEFLLTLPYDEDRITGREKDLKLFHWKNNGWEDITVSVDTDANTISGRASSFSPFAVLIEGGTYAVWSSLAPNDNPATPHKGYAVGTNKCAVCHSVHKAAELGEILLPVAVADACSYCHIETAVGNIRIYDATTTAYTSDVSAPSFGGGFSHTSPDIQCVQCHAVHGAKTLSGGNNAKILKDWTYWRDAPGGFRDYSTLALAKWATPADDTDKYEQQAAWCTGCHKYFIESYDESSTAVQYYDGTDWAFSGSHVMTSTHASYGNLAASASVTQVAWAPSTTCRNCHDAGAVDATGGIITNSFPHYTPDYYRFMYVGPSVASSTSANTTGTVDGLCLKCHRDGVTDGVGEGF